MRAPALALAAMVLLSGCFSFLEDEPTGPDDGRGVIIDDPDSYTVVDVLVEEGTLDAADGVEISYKVYEPLTRDARADGSPIEFPLIMLLHPFGFAKEYFEETPMNQDGGDPRRNIMMEFAQRGFVVVAHDNRGFGRSGGEVGIATAAEMSDIELLRQHVEATRPTNGLVGVAGPSLGGGTSLRAWSENPNIDAAANMFGWIDLYDAIMPGNVPKAQWAATLLALGTATSGGSLNSEVNGWVDDAVARQGLAQMEAQMDARSAGLRLQFTQKPLFNCQGMQETLFPQIDRIWEAHPGFTRNVVYTGGHASEEPLCWDKTLDFMDYWLRGAETGVDDWPFLETVDANEGPDLRFSAAALEDVPTMQWYLHQNNLVDGPSNREFTIQQRLAGNPLSDPQVIADTGSDPNQAVPQGARQDPNAEFFVGESFESGIVILGNPVVDLQLASQSEGADFQVVLSLWAVAPGGDGRIVSHGSFAHKAGETQPVTDNVTVEMTWTKATIPADGWLELKVAANDQNQYLPFPDDYTVVFNGQSNLRVPVLS